MKKLPIQLIFVFVLGAFSAAEARIAERIVAVVNREIVLLSELTEQLRPWQKQLEQIKDPESRKKKREEVMRKFLDRIIGYKLVEQEARKLQLTISEQQLEAALKNIMQRNNLTLEQLEAALKQDGKTLEAYKQKFLRQELIRAQVINVRVKSRVSVSEDEIRSKYQQNMRDLGVETKVRARHIFVHISNTASEKLVAERKTHAEALLKELKAGADFIKLAKEKSEDPVTRSEGGDLGFFARGTLPPHVEDVLFTMKKGEVKGPFRTSRGFHIIRLEDRKDSSARPLEDVRNQLFNQLMTEKMEKATQSWLNELRRRSHVDVRL